MHSPLTNAQLREIPVDVAGPLTDTELRASAVPISAATLPLPTGAATAALQTQPGVDIGDVTVNNGAAGAAVNVQDGGNVLSIDDAGGSLTVDGPLTDTQLRAATVPISGTVTAVADPRQQFSQFGELMVAQRFPQAAWRFNYGVIDKIITKTESNGGTVTVSGDKAVLSTGTNVAGSARIETIHRLRYLNGFGAYMIFTAIWVAGAANSHQIIGIGDTVDQIFIGDWNGSFVVGTKRGGAAPTTISSGLWNGNAPAFTRTFGNIFMVTFGWLGYQGPTFWIYDTSARYFKRMHTIDYADTSADVFILNPTLPLFAEAANTGNNTNLVMQTPSAVGGSQGNVGDEIHNPLNVYRPIDVSATYNNTNNNKILSIQNKATAFAGGISNRVPVSIRSIDFSRSSAGAATSTIRIYKNAATSADPLTFTDIDTNNSPLATNIVAATISSGTSEFSYTLSSTQTGRVVNFDDQQLIIYPGEVLTIAIQDSGVQSTEYTITINCEEQF